MESSPDMTPSSSSAPLPPERGGGPGTQRTSGSVGQQGNAGQPRRTAEQTRPGQHGRPSRHTRTRAPADTASYPAGPVRLGDLDTRLLVAFRTVATEGTFGKAARALGYTQSAISQQVATLEKALGGTVFQRPGGPRPVELTALGRIVFDRATEIVAMLESLATDVERFRSGDLGRVDIGTIQSTSTALLPTILRRLLGEHPGLQPRLEERYEELELVDLLLRGDLDVTFLVVGDPPGVASIEVLADPFVVLARAEDVGPGPVTPAQLAALPLIGQLGSVYQENMIDMGLRDVGCEPRYVFRSADNGAVISMVRAGLGVALLPRLAVLDEVADPRLALRVLDPPIPERMIRLAWRSGTELSPAAARFVAITGEVAAEVAQRSAELTAAHAGCG